MRIVSLLPSATEALFALGLGRHVVAVTHECDFPPEAEAAQVPAEIDAVGASRVVVMDGSAYFNRPGPRLVDSLEQLVANR